MWPSQDFSVQRNKRIEKILKYVKSRRVWKVAWQIPGYETRSHPQNFRKGYISNLPWQEGTHLTANLRNFFSGIIPAENVNKFKKDFYEVIVYIGIWNTFLTTSNLYPQVISHYNILCADAIIHKILAGRIPAQPEVTHLLYWFKKLSFISTKEFHYLFFSFNFCHVNSLGFSHIFFSSVLDPQCPNLPFSSESTRD